MIQRQTGRCPVQGRCPAHASGKLQGNKASHAPIHEQVNHSFSAYLSHSKNVKT